MRVAEEFPHSEVEMKGWSECLERWLEWKGTSLWVSMVEKPCAVGWDMEVSVEVMPVEQVESMDWIGHSERIDSWMPLLGSSYKVQAEYQ